MRVRIDLDGELLSEVDRLAGARGRSAFIRAAIQGAVRQANRRSHLDAAAGSIPDHGDEWDRDPAAWVQEQRRSEARRAG